LPSHSSIDINFLLAIVDSWDSTNPGVGPDFLQISIDGVQIIQATFANASGSVTTPVGADIGGGLQHRGFNADWAERAYDAGDEPLLNIPHTSSSLTFELRAAGAGWQGTGNPFDGFDEAWGIDNLRVSVNTNSVPEGGSLALFVLGFANLCMMRRRRR
jgi:hypothetical protein